MDIRSVIKAVSAVSTEMKIQLQFVAAVERCFRLPCFTDPVILARKMGEEETER
jgi:hypothetical protein